VVALTLREAADSAPAEALLAEAGAVVRSAPAVALAAVVIRAVRLAISCALARMPAVAD